MDLNVLDFERPIAELDQKIEELRHVGVDSDIDVLREISKLEQERDKKIVMIFSKLDPGQIVQLARHPQRPHTVDYISALFTEFDELHGDRHFADDPAIIGGVARFNDVPVMVL
ncbi:MAG: acetyl-CoA carboxylase carboxyl transferase subunit alpha, partial [Gammaproteobacteria bacterium]|nr:acetyl-CoA carboxylase carboxyl transferase subunit alpha [Gammaproteobacteria bacterium]